MGKGKQDGGWSALSPEARDARIAKMIASRRKNARAKALESSRGKAHSAGEIEVVVHTPSGDRLPPTPNVEVLAELIAETVVRVVRKLNR